MDILQISSRLHEAGVLQNVDALQQACSPDTPHLPADVQSGARAS